MIVARLADDRDLIMNSFFFVSLGENATVARMAFVRFNFFEVLLPTKTRVHLGTKKSRLFFCGQAPGDV